MTNETNKSTRYNNVREGYFADVEYICTNGVNYKRFWLGYNYTGTKILMFDIHQPDDRPDELLIKNNINAYIEDLDVFCTCEEVNKENEDNIQFMENLEKLS